jgi:transposase
MEDTFDWTLDHISAHSAEADYGPARPRRFALSEKLRIVREASQPGIKFTHIERKYGLGKNVLAYWRKVYRDLAEAQVRAEQDTAPAAMSDELAALRVQVRQLERLLGQKTLEVEMLRGQLERSS